jgi:hypothetical protein
MLGSLLGGGGGDWSWTRSSITLALAEVNYMGTATSPEARHRISKEIAVELIKTHGAFAYLQCLEKLSGGTQQPKLWRDVLLHLDELTQEKRDGNAD